MADLAALFGPAWPQQFWDWLDEQKKWYNTRAVTYAGWTPHGFHAKVDLDGRETSFWFRPSEWECKARERELATHD
jgi:hypothetical protein